MAQTVVDFPQLCESCLGTNPYVRMQRTPIGGTCKMCTKPFELFKWRPGRGESYRKTEICRTCAKMKDICQTCILDLQYGLPSQLRDDVLSYAESKDSKRNRSIESDVTRDYKMQEYLRDPSLPNGGDSDSRILKMVRAVDHVRDNCPLKSAPMLSTGTSVIAEADRVLPLVDDIIEDSFCTSDNEATQVSSPPFVQACSSEIQKIVSKKRKSSPSALPPRPVGPPPSWAFKTQTTNP